MSKNCNKNCKSLSVNAKVVLEHSNAYQQQVISEVTTPKSYKHKGMVDATLLKKQYGSKSSPSCFRKTPIGLNKVNELLAKGLHMSDILCVSPLAHSTAHHTFFHPELAKSYESYLRGTTLEPVVIQVTTPATTTAEPPAPPTPPVEDEKKPKDDKMTETKDQKDEWGDNETDKALHSNIKKAARFCELVEDLIDVYGSNDIIEALDAILIDYACHHIEHGTGDTTIRNNVYLLKEVRDAFQDSEDDEDATLVTQKILASSEKVCNFAVAN